MHGQLGGWNGSFLYFFFYFFLLFFLFSFPLSFFPSPSLSFSTWEPFFIQLLGLPQDFIMVWFFKWLTAFLVYHRPLGLGMGPFIMFRVLVVEPYFPSVAWLIIRSIVRLFKFLYLPFGLSPFSSLGLDFGVTSFEGLPFGPF